MKRAPLLITILLLLQVAAVLTLLRIVYPTLVERPRVVVPPQLPPAPVVKRPAAVVILCYHAVAKKPTTPYVSSLSDFTAQMDWLAKQKYKVIPLSQLVGYFENKQTLPDSLVAITFDDGYESVYASAWPLMKQRGFPFSIFIYPCFIGKGRGSLNWEQIREMSDAGVEVGSHTMTHPVLTRKEGKSEKAYQRWLDWELKGSKDTIEARLKKPVPFLAYPYGAFDRTVEDAAKAAGYRCCLLVNAGVNDTTTSRYQLDRVIISRNYSLPYFRTVLENHSVELAGVTPYQGEEVAASRNLDISARIKHLDGFDRASIAMRVSRAKGTAAIDTATGLVRFLLDKPLTKGFHEAAVYARNTSGQRCMGCWMFLVRE